MILGTSKRPWENLGAVDLHATWLRLRWPLTLFLALTLVGAILLRYWPAGPADLQLAEGPALSDRVVHEGFLPDGRIDLNTASLDLLVTLPGVGPATAQEIITARSERPFASVSEVDECCQLGASDILDLESLAGVQ